LTGGSTDNDVIYGHDSGVQVADGFQHGEFGGDHDRITNNNVAP
jgi:hypothetical protein